ncbi:MAG: VOC family protein [Calditrichaeota bacterium]|nr:VOC family protein [Calditrichota bacterium]MCB0270049.1 VOC family protein [Calditrichota bacterium]
MQKITPFLWFDDNAEAAIQFYTSVFKNAKILNTKRTGDNGKLFTATIEIEGQQLMVLNGGPHFKMNPAISLFVDCKSQEEVNELWGKLSDGGEIMQCGWLTDKFGLTWQIIPSELGKLLNDPDPQKAQRVMDAMLKMKKIEISELRAAYEQQ